MNEELNSRKEKFLKGLSLIGIKYQPMFHSGDQLSNHYVFTGFPVAKFEFIKGTSVPLLVQNKCQKLFAKYFNPGVAL